MAQTTTARLVVSTPNDYLPGSRSEPNDYRIGSRFTLRPLFFSFPNQISPRATRSPQIGDH